MARTHRLSTFAWVVVATTLILSLVPWWGILVALGGVLWSAIRRHWMLVVAYTTIALLNVLFGVLFLAGDSVESSLSAL